MALKKGFLFTKGNCSLFHSFISMGGGIWGGWVIGNFVYILFTFLALSIYKFSVVAQKPFFHFDHSIVAPLPKPTKPVVKMNELEAKKFAADSVRHMLGGAPGTKVAWGEGHHRPGGQAGHHWAAPHRHRLQGGGDRPRPHHGVGQHVLPLHHQKEQLQDANQEERILHRHN